MNKSVALARKSVRESIAEYRKTLAECPSVVMSNGDVFEYPPVEEARWFVLLDLARYRREQRALSFVGPVSNMPF